MIIEKKFMDNIESLIMPIDDLCHLGDKINSAPDHIIYELFQNRKALDNIVEQSDNKLLTIIFNRISNIDDNICLHYGLLSAIYHSGKSHNSVWLINKHICQSTPKKYPIIILSALILTYNGSIEEAYEIISKIDALYISEHHLPEYYICLAVLNRAVPGCLYPENQVNDYMARNLDDESSPLFLADLYFISGMRLLIQGKPNKAIFYLQESSLIAKKRNKKITLYLSIYFSIIAFGMAGDASRAASIYYEYSFTNHNRFHDELPFNIPYSIALLWLGEYKEARTLISKYDKKEKSNQDSWCELYYLYAKYHLEITEKQGRITQRKRLLKFLDKYTFATNWTIPVIADVLHSDPHGNPFTCILKSKNSPECNYLNEYEVFMAHFSLSRREAQVCVYLLELFSLKDIASRLSISVNTVKSHAQRVYRKTSTNNRLDLIRKYQHIKKNHFSQENK